MKYPKFYPIIIDDGELTPLFCTDTIANIKSEFYLSEYTPCCYRLKSNYGTEPPKTFILRCPACGKALNAITKKQVDGLYVCENCINHKA